ncbi:MAG: hypothetical protein JWL76_986 [Thermoleophilia bacterium]|nr:hypothetical protein [Thermoleophilia bacterium]
MKAFRRIGTLALCGIMLGSMMSIVGAAPASARFSSCDQKFDSSEKQAARDYAKGKLSDADYAKIQTEIALHRSLWGC